MTQYLHELPQIRDGLDYLIKNDSVFSDLNPDLSNFEWPYFGPGFSGLCRIVCGQQVSTGAAKAIWERFASLCGDVSPARVLALSHEDMRGAGLSGQKVKYITGLAQAIQEGAFDPAALGELDDEGVMAAVMALKGFGLWSAEIYLMFCLARPDVWPAGDLGIQVGLQKYLSAEERPDEVRTRKEGALFAPHRTAASLLLWHLKAAN